MSRKIITTIVVISLVLVSIKLAEAILYGHFSRCLKPDKIFFNTEQFLVVPVKELPPLKISFSNIYKAKEEYRKSKAPQSLENFQFIDKVRKQLGFNPEGFADISIPLTEINIKMMLEAKDEYVNNPTVKDIIQVYDFAKSFATDWINQEEEKHLYSIHRAWRNIMEGFKLEEKIDDLTLYSKVGPLKEWIAIELKKEGTRPPDRTCFYLDDKQYSVVEGKLVRSENNIEETVRAKLSNSIYINQEDIEKAVPVILPVIINFDTLLQGEYEAEREKYLSQLKIYLYSPNTIIYRFYSDGTVNYKLEPQNPLNSIEKEYFDVGWSVDIWPSDKKYFRVFKDKGSGVIEFDSMLATNPQSYYLTAVSPDVKSQDFLLGRFKIGPLGFFDVIQGTEIKFPFDNYLGIQNVYPDMDGEKAIIFFNSDGYTAGPFQWGHTLYENLAFFSKEGDIKMIAKFKNPSASFFPKKYGGSFRFELIGWGENGRFYFKIGNQYWEVSFK